MSKLLKIKEKPILFDDEMVRAILSGKKTQTRRPVPDWQLPTETKWSQEFPDSRFISIAQRDPRYGFGVFGDTAESCMANYNDEYSSLCPYGSKGNHLWVREAHHFNNDKSIIRFRSDYEDFDPFKDDMGDDCDLYGEKWRPSIHMPRWASRIKLEITKTRVERLQDITKEDAIAEGFDLPAVTVDGMDFKFGARHNFLFRWDLIYKNRNNNPWVWVIEFKKINK